MADAAQRVFPLLVGLSTPVVTYVFLRHHSSVTLLGLVAALPLLAVLRPAMIITLLVPLCVLGHLAGQYRDAFLGATVILVIGLTLHLVSGSAALRRPHL